MRIALLGDIMFLGKFNSLGNREIIKYFHEVAQLLGEFDYVVGNLETPFVSDQQPNGVKSAHIKSNVKNIEILKYLNIDIVTLANNHIYDFGHKSYLLTKRLLDQSGIKYFGVEDKQVLIKSSNVKLAFHGYCCYSTNPLGLDKDVNVLDIAKVERQMILNRDAGYFNIVSVHCGQEHIHSPNYDHVLMARRFSDICPYVFYGHHPHVIQSMEYRNDSLIAYSLGNFCTDDIFTDKSHLPLLSPSEDNLRSVILDITIDEKGIHEYKTIPIYMGEDSISIGNESILDDVNSFNKLLLREKQTYIDERQSEINAYIRSRKKLRDFNWYRKRLNFDSIRLLLSNRRNNNLYKRHIKDQL